MIERKPNIDEAWKSLYSKLQEDNLLKKEEVVEDTKRWIVPFQWTAACVAVLLGVAFSFYYFDTDKVDLITLQNKGVDNILVKTLEDGSTVYLASNGSLNYPKSFSTNQRLVALHGEALFDIIKNPSKPFLIETEKVTVKVLGTAFNVKSYDDGRFKLSVKRGRVRVTEKLNGGTMIITAGQSVEYIGDRLYKYQTKDGTSFDFYKMKMRFKDENLANILHVINQNNKSCVVLKGEQLKNRKLNVEFYNNNVDEMTQIISLALNLKREVRKDTVYISQP